MRQDRKLALALICEKVFGTFVEELSPGKPEGMCDFEKPALEKPNLEDSLEKSCEGVLSKGDTPFMFTSPFDEKNSCASLPEKKQEKCLRFNFN